MLYRFIKAKNKKNMIKDLLKDMSKYLPAQIIPGVVGFISIPIVTRLFSPGDYGNYSLVLATVAILSLLVGWLSMSIIRFYPVFERDGKLDYFYGNIVKLFFISILIISVIFCGVLLTVKQLLSNQLYKLGYIGLILFVFTSLFNTLQHFLRSKRQVSWYSAFAIWKSVASIGLGLLLIVVFDFGIDGLLWGGSLSLILITPILWKKSISKVSLTNSKISTPLIKEVAKYSFPLVIANIAAWVLSLSDRYILQFFRDSREVGIYSVSYNISAHSIILLTTIFMLAAGPISINIWEKEGEEKSKLFLSKLTRYFLITCIPTVVGLSVLSKPIMEILTGREYFEGYKIIPFVTLGAFFLGLQQRFQAGFVLYKKTGFITFSIAASGLLNVVLNFLLIPKYGYMAAAITTLISYVFLLFLMVFISRRFFLWKFPFKSLAKITFASAIMGLVVYFIGEGLTTSIMVNLTLGISIGIVVYLLILLLLREAKEEEIKTLMDIRGKILRKMRGKINDC